MFSGRRRGVSAVWMFCITVVDHGIGQDEVVLEIGTIILPRISGAMVPVVTSRLVVKYRERHVAR